MAEATARPGVWLDGVISAASRLSVIRRFGRDIHFTVPICIALICGSFAATALLEMRLDKSRALSQAARFEQTRARDLAGATGAVLDRYARMGAVFAASPEQYRSADLGRAEPAIRDIAVWDAAGVQNARLNATATRPMARPAMTHAHAIIPGGLAFRDGSRTVAVLFDPSSLMPGSGARRLVPPGQAAGPNASLSAPVPGWPAAIENPAGRKGDLERLGRLAAPLSVCDSGPGADGGLAGSPVGRQLRAPGKSGARHPRVEINPPHRGPADGAAGQCGARRRGSRPLQIGIHRPYEP